MIRPPVPKIWPLRDEEIIRYLSEIDFKNIFLGNEVIRGSSQLDGAYTESNSNTIEFIETHTSWIKNCTVNKVIGLDDFKFRNIIHGTSEALQEYHWAFRNHRLRVYEKEYAFHNLSLSKDEYVLVHEDDFKEGDALIISLPFSGFGKVHPEYNDVMEICTEKNIPVLIDSAWFGGCQDIEFRLDYPCIEAVCFSTSKCLCTGLFRVGTLFSRNPAPHAIDAYNVWGNVPSLNARISIELMKKFSADFIPNKYRPIQLEVCDIFGCEATNTIMLGLGDHPYETYWPEKIARADFNDETFWRWGLCDSITDQYKINNGMLV